MASSSLFQRALRSAPLALLLLLALALRLLVWRWREFYPLGGDEQEYFNQALTLLREWRYEELRLMRPPLYGVVIAGWIVLVDSLVQNLRLIQALISTATVAAVWLLTREVVAGSAAPVRRRAPLAAGLLCALSYTLAANATELLTETLFLFGLTTFFWLLLRAVRQAPAGAWSAAAAGLTLGALCLTRSVALPLLPLGALWLGLVHLGAARSGAPRRPLWRAGAAPLLFAVCTTLLVAPWTARNYLTYGAMIVIDTTGPENLWLDNDPAGREVVKAQLYALGPDMAARQQLATQQGVAVIAADPQRFVAKAGGELLKFFALEYADDMRARPAIWLPPAEVGARLLLGDGLWLLLLCAGVYGLARGTGAPPGSRSTQPGQRLALASPRWVFAPWALYVLLTALIFHVELRYRLPLYPVLLPYAAVALVGAGRAGLQQRALALAPVALCLALTLLHRPYPLLAWQLGAKHLHLAQAEQALARGAAAEARASAQAALDRDERSALARVALARAALLDADRPAAEALLRAAIASLPAHAHAHLLLGDLLRQQGDAAAARRALAYETTSLQDLQAWSRQRFTTPPASALAVGDGLDLGFVEGFHAAEPGGWRWTRATARVTLAAPAGATTLRLRLASGRPPGAPAPTVEVLRDGAALGRFSVTAGWRDYRLPLAFAPGAGPLTVELRSATFTPRDYDRASPDGRRLGVMVDLVAIEP